MPDDQQTPQQPDPQKQFGPPEQQPQPFGQPYNPQPTQDPYANTTPFQADSPAVEAIEAESFAPGSSAATTSSSLGDVSTMPPLQPLAPVAPTQPFGAMPAKKNRKKLVVGLIIAIIIALLLAATAAAYKFWYQNPQKVVTDALIHAVEAKSVSYIGNLTTESDGTKLNLDISGGQTASAGSLNTKATITNAGQTYSLNANGLIDSKGDLYLQLQNLNPLADMFKKQFTAPAENTAVSPLIDQLKAKLDGTWIKISNQDLKGFSDSYATDKTCLTDAAKTLKTNSAASGEIRDLYTKHEFISIDKSLGSKNGSLGYVISSNEAAEKAFVDGLKDTKIYKQLHSCDSSFTINSSDITSNSTKDTSTVTVWVSRWSHELTNLTVSDKSSGDTTTATITPTFNKPVTIKTPSTSTSLSQLESDIMALIESIYMSSYSSSYGTTTTPL